MPPTQTDDFAAEAARGFKTVAQIATNAFCAAELDATHIIRRFIMAKRHYNEGRREGRHNTKAKYKRDGILTTLTERQRNKDWNQGVKHGKIARRAAKR